MTLLADLNAALLEFRFSLRRLRTARQFSFITIATLTLGIGASCFIFALVNAFYIHPLPYADAEHLVIARETFGNYAGSISYPNYLEWANQNRSFTQIGLIKEDGANVVIGQSPAERVSAAYFTANMLSILGIQPILGHPFTAADEARDHPSILLLTYQFWQDRFHGDPTVLGQTVTIDGVPASIIGVLPPSFRFPIVGLPDDIVLPIAIPSDQRANRGSHSFGCLAKLKPDVTIQAASKDLQLIARRISAAYPEHGKNRSARLDPVIQMATREPRESLRLLFGSVLFLLLIACVNVANLMLSRSSVRHGEFAIRTALGAGRWRLAWQFISEGLIIAGIAGVFGLVFGIGALKLLILRMPELDYALRFALDLPVLGFGFVLVLVSAVLPSLAPMWQTTRRKDAGDPLKDGERTTPERGTRRLRNLLVVAQTAIAFILLTAAVLLLNSFIRLNQTDSGLDTRDVTIASISATDEDLVGFFHKALDRLHNIQGVSSVGAVSLIPGVEALNNTNIYIEGVPRHDRQRVAEYRVVAGDYFQTVGIRLLRGRYFAVQDDAHSEPVVVINQATVKAYFPTGVDPLGSHIFFQGSEENIPIRVIGIVADYHNYGVAQPPFPELYRPIEQSPYSDMRFVVRSKSNDLAAAMRSALHSLNPNLALFRVRPLAEALAGTLTGRQTVVALLVAFAFSALLLAAVGVYSVTAYVVGQRTREIGVRMAIGASHDQIFRQTTSDGLRFVLVGLAVGIVIAIAIGQAASSLLKGFLFHVAVLDPFSYLIAALVLGLVGFAGCAGPARWASRVDPAVALRRHGTMLELIPKRTSVRWKPVPAAQPKEDLSAGVAAAARHASDWSQLFSSISTFVAESCGVECATLLARSEDGSQFEALNHSTQSLPAQSFVVRRLEHLETLLPLTQEDFATWQHAHLNAGREDEIRILSALNARFLVPVRTGNRLTGILALGPARQLPPAPRPLQNLASQLGLLLENSRLAQRAAEAQFLKHEMDLAVDVQRRLLPSKPPEIPGLQLAGLCQPALGVGGDYFDYFPVGDRLALLVADVAGKGMAAALVVSLLYSALRTLAPKANGDVASMIGELNRLLQRATQPRAFATLFYAEFDPASRQLTYCNAAHMPPLLRRNGSVTRMPGGGLVVGMFPRAKYDQHTVTLEPGDRLLIYSDGVTESPNDAGDDFGEDRLKDTLNESGADLQQAASGILLKVKEFSGKPEPFDDLTVLLLNVEVAD